MSELENKANLLQRIKNTVETDVHTNNSLAQHEQFYGSEKRCEYFRGRRDYAKMILDAIINEEKL